MANKLFKKMMAIQRTDFRAGKEFLWNDRVEPETSNVFSLSGIVRSFVGTGEKNKDGQAVSTWARAAMIGDTWENKNNTIRRVR